MIYQQLQATFSMYGQALPHVLSLCWLVKPLCDHILQEAFSRLAAVPDHCLGLPALCGCCPQASCSQHCQNCNELHHQHN